MKRSATINGVIVECVRGNIVAQKDMTAVVNAANAELMPGGGVAGAIHRAAGPHLVAECRPLAPIKPGEAVITRGHNLPNAYIIHCLGPVYGVDKPEDKILADCYRNALRLAEEHKIDSISFPAISTGAFGYPMEAAAEIAFRTIRDMISELHYVKKIRFILYKDRDLKIHEEVLARFLGE
jgi:O-acetyl-ADP-ribose deacetylase (regulator of RNase III)